MVERMVAALFELVLVTTTVVASDATEVGITG